MSAEDVAFVREQIAMLKELIETRLEGMDKALALQAREYERRLETLNHAHRQAEEALARTVQQDVFDETMKALNERQQSQDLKQVEYTTRRSVYAGIASTLTSLIIVLLGWLLAIFL